MPILSRFRKSITKRFVRAKISSKNGGAALNQAEYIAGKLGMNYCFCKAMDYDGGEYGTAILSRYPAPVVQENPTAERRYFGLNQELNQEPPGAVKIDVPGYPAPITAVITHLDYTSAQLRTKQVRALTSGFSEFLNGPLILLGDLNLTPDSDEYQHLMQFFCETDAKLTPTEPSWEPQNKIDYILLSKTKTQGPFWDIKNFDIPQPEDKILSIPYAEISDHLPITATIRLIPRKMA